jgi:hypothetical protein
MFLNAAAKMSDTTLSNDSIIPTSTDASSSTVVVHHTTINDDYELRKHPRAQYVKGVISTGKTIRRRSGKTPLCEICWSSHCKHLDAIHCKYTDNSRIQKKNVHKCDCCSDTHICEHLIPVRGRHIKPDTE